MAVCFQRTHASLGFSTQQMVHVISFLAQLTSECCKYIFLVNLQTLRILGLDMIIESLTYTTTYLC